MGHGVFGGHDRQRVQQGLAIGLRQGSWNQRGSGQQGQLYVCTSTDTWTLHYTPYTYPHPLVQGTGTGDVIIPPTNVTATAR